MISSIYNIAELFRNPIRMEKLGGSRNCFWFKKCNISMIRGLCLFLLTIILTNHANALDFSHTAICSCLDSKEISCDCKVLDGFYSNGSAWGLFHDEINENGWGELFITTNSESPNSEQAFAAGYLEAVLTFSKIICGMNNFKSVAMRNGSLSPAVNDFIEKQREWVFEKARSGEDHYWRHVQLILLQFEGLVSGMISKNDKNFNKFVLYAMNMASDLEDLVTAFGEPSTSFPTRGHCSVLIMAAENDLFLGHNTWGDYMTMLRIYKHMKLSFKCDKHSCGHMNSRISYSSYPGLLFSDDDWYLVNGQDSESAAVTLVVTETTNDNLNSSLWDLLKPTSIFTWMRAILANRLALSGSEWLDVFGRHNSGTYNSQWMVVDMERVHQRDDSAFVDGTLSVGEQMPGVLEQADLTSYLNESPGFWASYNRPYFERIFKEMGYEEWVTRYGPQFSYSDNSRAKIFDREVKKEKSSTWSGFKSLMRFNEWKTDPFSYANAGQTICSRFDLAPASPPPPIDWWEPGCHGGIDAKVTRYAWIFSEGEVNLRSEAICGPTHEDVDQTPVFDWRNAAKLPGNCPTLAHNCHPDRFDFDWTVKENAL